MSRSTPLHKQTDPNKQAGQHVYSFDREPYLKHSNVAPDVTLSDYIARKEEGSKKLTFDEWWGKGQMNYHATYHTWAKEIWETALKQGKL